MEQADLARLKSGPRSTTDSLYMHYTISQDMSGSADDIKTKLLAALGERQNRNVGFSESFSRKRLPAHTVSHLNETPIKAVTPLEEAPVYIGPAIQSQSELDMIVDRDGLIFHPYKYKIRSYQFKMRGRLNSTIYLSVSELSLLIGDHNAEAYYDHCPQFLKAQVLKESAARQQSKVVPKPIEFGPGGSGKIRLVSAREAVKFFGELVYSYENAVD